MFILGIEVDSAQRDEEDLSKLLAVSDDLLPGWKLTGVHLNDKLIAEACLTRVEKMVKFLLEDYKGFEGIYEHCLHLRW